MLGCHGVRLNEIRCIYHKQNDCAKRFTCDQDEDIEAQILSFYICLAMFDSPCKILADIEFMFTIALKTPKC